MTAIIANARLKPDWEAAYTGHVAKKKACETCGQTSYEARQVVGYVDELRADLETMRKVLGLLLQEVDMVNGDNYALACCRLCWSEPWHRRRYGDAGGAVGDAIYSAVVETPCLCVCHDARLVLGLEDDANDARYPSPRPFLGASA